MPKIKNIKKKHQGINPDVAVFYKTCGNHLLHLGKIQESIDYFDKAISYNPYYAEAYNEKAFALAFQYKYQESLITINKAIITKPYYYELYINKSILLYILGMVDEASIALNKGLQLNPEALNVTPTPHISHQNNTDIIGESSSSYSDQDGH